MLDLPPDEAMVELAIALSLQDQEGGEGNQLAQGLQGLHQLANLGEEFAGLLGGQVWYRINIPIYPLWIIIFTIVKQES